MTEKEGATLGIGAVARRTGLTPDVLRVWERRYRAVAPDRSRGGTRFYTESEVRRLEVLARLVSRGHRIGRLASLEIDELEALAGDEARDSTAPSAVAPAPDDSAAQAPEGWLEGAIAAARDVDAGALDHQMTSLFLALGPRRFTLEVALPLLLRVGDLWAAGEISIAGEHATVAILRSLLGGALRRHRHRPSAQRAIFATPAGQRHEFGALAAALLAADQGVDAIYLGADLPCADLIGAVEKTKAQAVVLGLSPCAIPETKESSEDFVSALRQGIPRDVVLGVGGDVDRERMRSLGVLVFGSLSAFDDVVGRFGRVPSAAMLGMGHASGWNVVEDAS